MFSPSTYGMTAVMAVGLGIAALIKGYWWGAGLFALAIALFIAMKWAAGREGGTASTQ